MRYNRTGGACCECKAARDRELYIANAEKKKAAVKEYRKTHPPKRRDLTPEERRWQSRDKSIRRIPGFTRELFQALEVDHDGKCGICGLPPAKRHSADQVLHIDHCHVTGRVRGLLCHPCNVGLGMFAEDADRLLRATAYLEKYRPQ